MLMSYACSEEKQITLGTLMMAWHTTKKGVEDLKTVNKEHFKMYVINDVSSVS